MADDTSRVDGDIQEVPIEQIDYKVKQVDPDEYASLRNSIRELGRMLHPPTGMTVDGRIKIVAGDKRLMVAKELNWSTVRVMVVPQMDDTQAMVTHLHENLFRYNLPWYEAVVMEKELHELRQQQFGKGRKGRGSTGWSLRDTAEELRQSFGGLSEDLRLAEAVLLDPNLRKIKDKQTAKRLIFEGIKRNQAEVDAGLKTDIEYDKVWLGSAANILSFYPENCMDVCVTDPPWLSYKDQALVKDEETWPVFEQVFRVLKWNSFLYMFVSTPDWVWYQKELPKLGFKVQEMPLIWVKENVITHGKKSWEYNRNYEPILLAVKGAPALTTSNNLSAIFSVPGVHPTKMIHPNEKPIGLLKTILGHCSYDGSIVLDPFGGSGVTSDAAKQMGRRYITVERDKKFFEGIERRLNCSSAEQK